MNSAGEIINITTTCEFQPDANVGNAGNAVSPFILIVSFSDAEGISGLPKEFALYNNYPNPFNPETIIKFQIPQSAFVSLKIYNVAGQLIKTLLSEEFPAGIHHITWDGRNDSGQQVSSGVYIYRIKADNYSAIKKMMFLK